MAIFNENDPRAGFADQVESALAAVWRGDSAEFDRLLNAEENGPGVGELFPVLALKECPATAIPDRIGEYRILGKIGQGGMAIVYEAEQNNPRRTVALKVIRGGCCYDEYRLKLFQREAQTLALLQHPGIARIYDAGCTEDGQHFLVMELVRGQALNDYVSRKTADGPRTPLDLGQRLSLFRRVCDAVHYAHQRGVVHRDLKPSNILVAREDGSTSVSERSDPVGSPKVVDFGLACAMYVDSATSSVSIDHARINGTLAYMSPEQVQGSRGQIDVRTDVYSLGIVLYGLATDRVPFDFRGRPMQEIARLICEASPPRPRSLVNRVPRDLETIILKALEKDPERRYPSVLALADDVRRFEGKQPIAARPPSVLYQLRKLMARHTLGTIACATFLLFLIAFGVTAAIQAQKITEQSQRARTEAHRAEAVCTFLQHMLAGTNPELAGKDATVVEILDAAGQQSRTQLADQPAVAATVLETIGDTYRSRGLYDKAEASLRDALRMRSTHSKAPDLTIASARTKLADILSVEGKYTEAEDLYRQALATRRKLLGTANIEVADNLQGLANISEDRGDYDTAERLCRQALDIKRTALGEEDPAVACSLNTLAWLLYCKGQYAEAEPVYHQALDMRRKLLGPEHPAVADTLNNLAILLKAKGDYDAAEAVYRQALDLHRKLFGDEHPLVATSLNNLAVLLMAKGEYDDAEPMCRQALAIRRKVLGPDHPDLASSLNNMAYLLKAKGEYQSAARLFREALASFRSILGDEHPSVATVMDNLADALAGMGNDAKAEPLYRDALAMHRKLLGDHHPNVAVDLSDLAELLATRGDDAAARPLVEQALRIQRKELPKTHRSTAQSLTTLGMILLQEGDPQAAEPLLREALTIRKTVLPRGHRLIAQTKSILGDCLTAQSRYQEAAEEIRSNAVDGG